MPRAVVYVITDPKVVTDDQLKQLGPFLTECIAGTLSCEQEKLATANIEVAFHEPGPHDVNMQPLQVEVTARSVGDRVKHRPRLEKEIRAAIRKSNILPKKLVQPAFLVMIKLWV